MSDQAEGLRRLADSLRPPSSGRSRQRATGSSAAAPPAGPGARLARVLAVTSGKGGVGKTNLAVNLSLAFRELGQEVALVDADLGLANADLLLGVVPQRHLGDVLEGRCSVVEALQPVPGGIHLLAGASGLVELAHADAPTLRRLVGQLRILDRQVDLVVIDTGAGIGRQVLNLVGAAREVLVVLTPEPTSLTDAYSLVKVMADRRSAARWYVVVNMSPSVSEGLRVAERLSAVVRRYLGMELTVLGCVPRDEAVGQAVLRQVPVLLAFPRSPAARAVRAIAARLLGLPPLPGGGLSGALWRLFGWRRGTAAPVGPESGAEAQSLVPSPGERGGGGR